ncbi:MAG: Maf-like protein [Candidatus Taylorbacteria bacterium]|nr:Maf-like protein [Candidatus Taylorbacteria bacterium]
MKIYVLGSNAFIQEMVECRDKLRELGYDGWIHPEYELMAKGLGDKVKAERAARGEHAAIKRENNYLKVHYAHILESDAVLFVNLEKNGKKNYIGGNVLIEMGQAYVNDKKIFLLTEIPTYMPYADEIEAMDPVCLHGDLANIERV